MLAVVFLFSEFSPIEIIIFNNFFFITSPNWSALDGRTVLRRLRRHDPGFQKLIFIYVPNCKWIPLKKLSWIPLTKNCNVNFVGKFVVSRIQQQVNIASSSGFYNGEWIPQKVSGVRTYFLNELAYEQLKARAGILIFSNAEFKSKVLTIVIGIHEQILRFSLVKLLDVIF